MPLLSRTHKNLGIQATEYLESILKEEMKVSFKNMLLYPPQQYYKILIEHQLFFYNKDVLTALQKGFNLTPDCEAYLHRIWRVLQ